MAGAKAIRFGITRVEIQIMMNCNHAALINSNNVATMPVSCNQGAKTRNSFTSPIPSTEINPKKKNKAIKRIKNQVKCNLSPAMKSAGQIRQKPQTNEPFLIRKVCKSRTATQAPQVIQIVKASKCNPMTGKLRGNLTSSSLQAMRCVKGS